MDEILADDDAETSDYNDSTDNDIDNSNGNVISLGTERRVGTGRVFPTKFNPPNPNDTPVSLFPLGRAESVIQYHLYIENGGQNPRAGCCFVYGSPHGYISFPLEKQGPTGIPSPQTSNRAELRAVIAATRYRDWVDEGCRCLVIATDSEYVVEGMTKWVKVWIRNGWRTSTRVPVKNKDLWRCLLGEVERWDEEGMRIQVWRIPREWNTEADEPAKEAANDGAPQSFGDICGVLV
ncbi:unnamed protein product [Penicillium viridicatum]